MRTLLSRTVLWLLAIPLAAQSRDMGIMKTDFPNDSRVKIERLQDIPTGRFPAGLEELRGRLSAGAILVTNHSQKRIMAVVGNWQLTDPTTGRQFRRQMNLDGYRLVPAQAIIEPGQSAIVTSRGSAIPDNIWNSVGTAAFTNFPFEPTGGLIVNDASIDLIVFDDGELIGANRLHYEQSILAHFEARRELMSEIQRRSHDSPGLESYLRELVTNRSPASGTESLKRDYARYVQHFSDRKQGIQWLESGLAVPSFHRVGGN